MAAEILALTQHIHEEPNIIVNLNNAIPRKYQIGTKQYWNIKSKYFSKQKRVESIQRTYKNTAVRFMMNNQTTRSGK